MEWENVRVMRVTWLVGAILGALVAFLTWAYVYAQDVATIPTEPQVAPPAIMSWQFIVTVIAPPIITAFLMKPTASPAAKTAMMVFWSVVAVGVGMFLRGELAFESAEQALATILFAVVMSAGFYKGIQKPVGITPATVGVK